MTLLKFSCDFTREVGDIGHKDTLLTIPTFHPHQALRLGISTRVKISSSGPRCGLTIWISCILGAKNTLALSEDHYPVPWQDQEA